MLAFILPQLEEKLKMSMAIWKK